MAIIDTKKYFLCNKELYRDIKLVLLSIQSLLGEYPIQNEPGFDQTKPDDQNSINYSNYIIYHTC